MVLLGFDKLNDNKNLALVSNNRVSRFKSRQNPLIFVLA